MKKVVIVLGSAIILLAACSKDDDGVELQPHDQNQMMDTMHAMMDKMMAMQPTNDPDVDFAKMMIIHHEGAISMSNLELQAGKNDSLKNMAKSIIAAQQSEIGRFNSVLGGLTADDNDPEFTAEQMDNMMKGGSVADIQLITGDIDNDFATLMIVHHQGALDNASAYLHHGNNAELKAMATDIVNAQIVEIQKLSHWLKTNKR